MSEHPELPPDEALAAEHALGVLSGPERAQAERRMARDPAFAALVEAWRERLSPLLAQVEDVAPSADIWSRIEKLLPANDSFEALRRRVATWRRATAGSLALAAASLAAVAILASQPAKIVTVQAPMTTPLLNANLETEGGKPMFVAAYDPARKALIITSLAAPGSDPAHVHELWIIPADGKPHSLGMVEPGTSKRMPMPGDMAPMMAEGGTLAITVEPPGGSPSKDAPSGPMAASGKLLKI